MAPTQQQSKDAKTRQLSGGKAPKHRTQRYLTLHDKPKLIEGAKSVLLLKGIKCSEAMFTVLKDFRCIQAPHAKLLSKNNKIMPFDEDVGIQSLEFLTTKNDCSMFALASHNKKRPHNLTIGRTYDRHLLDMVELGILKYKSLGNYKGCPKKRIGSKPMLLFQGDIWHLDASYERLQNILIDFYRGDPVKELVVSGLDHIIMFTISAKSPYGDKPVMHMRTYFCELTKNSVGGKVPLPILTPCGPDMDFYVRRTNFATPDVYKVALKQPKANKPKKIKNQSTNLFGETMGRLHIGKQNVMNMRGKRVKALRKAEHFGKDKIDE